jgi:hypothetical protein
MVDRAGALQRVGGNAQDTGFRADDRIPSKSAANAELLRNITGMLGGTGGISDWIGGLFGGSNYGFGGFANPDEFAIW